MTSPQTNTDTTTPVALRPPVAERRPVVREHHGEVFTDDYEWLRDKESPEVIAHLEAENAYTAAVTADQEPLRRAIFAEIKAHTVETDLSVPSRKDDWWYFVRTEEGRQYAVHCRVPARDTGDPHADWTPPVVTPGVPVAGEQVILDGNAEAEGQPFFSLGGMAVSPDGNLMAYAVDHSGDERFTLRVRDLRTGEDLADEVPDVAYGVLFDRTGTRVLYTVPDESWRPYRVLAHALGTPVDQDRLLFQEDDPGMWSGIGLSADRTELVISIGNSEVAETRALDLPESAAEPLGEPRVLVDRALGLLHGVDPVTLHGERHYVIVHDRDAPNNMVSLAPRATVTDPDSWRTVVGHSETTKVDGAAVTATHLALAVRRETTPRTVVLPLEGLGTAEQAAPVEPAFGEELYSCELAGAPYESPFLRLSYTSWVTPAQVLDWEAGAGADAGALHVRRQVEVPGHDPGQYLVERWWAPAESTDRRVGIPLTVIRRRDTPWDGSNPCVVYGYGSYEASMDPGLSVARLSLLDRGVVYVVAHVRGGGELGRGWYEHGKKLHKANTFTDFVDATRFVAQSGWVDPDRIACMGGSAGGLLMGAVLNLAPELYRACLAQVPFVDALTSILDPDLPLSALEWEEWGNPITDPEVYRYMAGYSPYENVRAADYPAIAAVTSLNDTRVLYVEPAKWVQQLRRTVTSDQSTPLAAGGAPIVLKTEMDGGHGGASGRYRAWEDRAWDYAFLLTAFGATVPVPGAQPAAPSA
ncbi:S9 family peptidase [Citricoccus sp. SGAir0253]|uniref:S9 family peptidase n=1 Tax=Citricoccus sp. SGAir0253 TaxID=2567881 RepID=UPI0010CD5D66|nr:S9 family peptidase [Citricoccus sp. SGAir0253]QCU77379.1 S9 family peptidase [Citricoccus sp. SGAir0253]